MQQQRRTEKVVPITFPKLVQADHTHGWEEEQDRQAVALLHEYPIAGLNASLVSREALAPDVEQRIDYALAIALHPEQITVSQVAADHLPAETPNPLVDSQEPVQPHEPPADKLEEPLSREPFSFPLFVFILLAFVLLDSLFTSILPNPQADITITPLARAITTTTTISIVSGSEVNGIPGRLLPPVSQTLSKTIAASGHGHQEATRSYGLLTFYNGSLNSQTIPAGTTFTGSDGVTIQTDADVTIPPNNPPLDGQASVNAHAVNTGSRGNIQAGDVNLALSSFLVVKNQLAFLGGQNEQNFLFVQASDIQTTKAELDTEVLKSLQASVHQELQTGEALIPPTCSTSTRSDHQIGEEANTVTVTLTTICSAVEYNQQALQDKADGLLTRNAVHQLGTAYHLFGTLHTTVLTASRVQNPPTLALVLLHITGTWMYQLNQQQFTTLVAGKSKQEALQALLSQPGITNATIAGIADNSQLPQDTQHIHFLILVGVEGSYGSTVEQSTTHYIWREMIELARFLAVHSVSPPHIKDAVQQLRDDLIKMLAQGITDVTVDRNSYLEEEREKEDSRSHGNDDD